jgi:hypothetical protein
MQGANELQCVLALHVLDGSDPGCQTEALERAVQLANRLNAWEKRRRAVALLCGFDTPSLTARRATPPSLNQDRPGQFRSDRVAVNTRFQITLGRPSFPATIRGTLSALEIAGIDHGYELSQTACC